MSGQTVVKVGVGLLILLLGLGGLVHLAGLLHAAHGGP